MNGVNQEEFQIVGAAVQKEREPKIRLVRGTCKRLEEEDDIRTRVVSKLVVQPQAG